MLLAVSGVQVQVNHGDDCSFISVRLFVSHVTVALIFEILCKWLNFPSLFSAPEFEFPRNAPPWLLPHRVVARSVDAVTG